MYLKLLNFKKLEGIDNTSIISYDYKKLDMSQIVQNTIIILEDICYLKYIGIKPEHTDVIEIAINEYMSVSNETGHSIVPNEEERLTLLERAFNDFVMEGLL